MRHLPSVLFRRAGVLFATMWVAIFLASAGWAVATPLAASPDEPAHIVKAAAVVRGELIGTETSRPAYRNVTVPAYIADAGNWPCYAFRPTVSAGCEHPIEGTKDVKGITSAALYNPIYYALVGWPSLIFSTPTLTVLAMRFLGAFISSGLLAAGFSALARRRRTLFAGGAMLAVVTPMVLFLNGSVNPNSVEYAGGFAFAAALFSLCRDEDDTRLRWRLIVLGVSGVLFVNARGLSPLWMALIGITALIMVRPVHLGALLRKASVIITLCVLAIAVAFACVWIIATGTLHSMGNFAGQGYSPAAAFLRMLLDESFDPGIVGDFGWLDTSAPQFTYALWWALTAILVGAAAFFTRGRIRIAVVFSFLVFLLVPAIVQTESVKSSGFIWQGRYTLVAFLAMLATAGFALGEGRVIVVGERGRDMWRRLATGAGIVVVIGQLYTALFALRRYVIGSTGTWTSMIKSPQWQPPGTIVFPLALILVGAALMVVVWRGTLATALYADADAEPALDPKSDRESSADRPLLTDTV